MKRKALILFSVLSLSFISIMYSKSLWDNGMNFYKVNVKKGDIIKIRFLEKTIMKYKMDQRQSDFESRKGVKGKGDLFNFFPDVEVNADNNLRNQNNLSVDNETSFSINAKITAVNDNTAVFDGYHSTLINGEIFKLEISGEFDVNSLGSGSSISSTDIYDLDFRVLNESPTNAVMFNQDDLVFSTNYTDIVSNQVLSSNNITNMQITTNLSSFKLELAGIRDSKKKELLMNYLNSMINLLFR